MVQSLSANVDCSQSASLSGWKHSSSIKSRQFLKSAGNATLRTFAKMLKPTPPCPLLCAFWLTPPPLCVNVPYGWPAGYNVERYISAFRLTWSLPKPFSQNGINHSPELRQNALVSCPPSYNNNDIGFINCCSMLCVHMINSVTMVFIWTPI